MQKLILDKVELCRLYVSEKKTAREIASLLNCGIGVVYRNLKFHAIHTRSKSEILAGNKRTQGYHHTNESRQKISEAGRHRKHTPETRVKISESNKGKIGSNRGKRFSSEHKKKIGDALRGEKCYLWQGGKSFEPYCPKFNNVVKEEIRTVFQRKCFLCGSTEDKKPLMVHHCDYDKGQGCGKKWNLSSPLQFLPFED